MGKRGSGRKKIQENECWKNETVSRGRNMLKALTNFPKNNATIKKI